MNQFISISAFSILSLLWLAFAAGLVFNRPLLDKSWPAFRRLPFLVQILSAFLFLPVVLGLWIWHASWPAWLRLALVAALAFATLYTFFPWPLAA